MPDYLGLADKSAAKGKYSKASYLVLRHIADQGRTVSITQGKPRTWETLDDIPADVDRVVDEPNDDGQALAYRDEDIDDTGWSYVMLTGPFENCTGPGEDLKGPFTEYLD